MKRYLQIILSLLFTFIVATACHDESEEIVELSVAEMVKSGKKKPKMVYSSGEKGRRATAESDNEDQENNEKLEVTMDVDGADLHIHCEGYMESAYLFIQDQSYKVIFTQNVALIDKDHPLDVYIPEAEDYPYYLQIESEKYFASIRILLE